jgi:hypothetical protein
MPYDLFTGRSITAQSRCSSTRLPPSDAPMGHSETVTFIAGLRQTDVVAPMLIKGAMNARRALVSSRRRLHEAVSTIALSVTQITAGSTVRVI